MELPKPAFFTRFMKYLNMSRVVRLNMHYKALQPHLKPKGKRDSAEVMYFSQKFENYYSAALRLVNIRGFLYALLYASLVVNAIKLIPFLEWVIPFIRLTGSLVSTSLLVFLIFVLSVKVNLYIELLNECLTHIVAMYHRNPERNSQQMLEDVSKTI